MIASCTARLGATYRLACGKGSVFKCSRYSAIIVSSVVGNAAVFVAWQTFWRDPMSRHFTLSWEGMCKRRIWTIWTSQFSHRSLEHLISNVSVFVALGYALQGILSVRLMGAHLFYTPLVASGASLSYKYYLHGPEEAKALSRQYPSLDWNRFCHYRFLELKNGLLSAMTPLFCHFQELGIPPETTVPASGYNVPELVILFEPYETWFYESTRGTLGMSAIVTSLEGFGAAWLVHLATQGAWTFTVGVSLGLLLLQPTCDLKAFVNPTGSIGAGTAAKDGVGSRTDVAGHLAGFGNGILLYLLRCQSLSRTVKQVLLSVTSMACIQSGLKSVTFTGSKPDEVELLSALTCC